MRQKNEELSEALNSKKDLLQELVDKIGGYKGTIAKMRFDYMRELDSLREMIERKTKLRDNFEYLEVRFFSATDGLEKETLDLLNKRLLELQETYNEILARIQNRYANMEV